MPVKELIFSLDFTNSETAIRCASWSRANLTVVSAMLSGKVCALLHADTDESSTRAYSCEVLLDHRKNTVEKFDCYYCFDCPTVDRKSNLDNSK